LVEPGGIEPPSASPPQAVLHAYSVNLDLTSGVGLPTNRPLAIHEVLKLYRVTRQSPILCK